MSISDFAAVGGEADAEQSDTNQTEKPPSLLSDSMLLGLDSIYTLVHLTRSEALMDLLTSIQTLDMSITSKKIIVPDDPEQALLTQAIEMIVSLEKEKHIAYRFACAHYEGRFPELESFLVDAVLYVRVVRTLGNESLLDLSTSHRLEALYTLLPSQLVAVLIVVASTTSGVSLPADDWRVIEEACREMETLEQAREILLEYIQSRMPLIAPNLCILVGTAIASQLIGTAGSLQKLAQMPPNELMTLGSIRVTSTNFSIGVGGFLLNCDLLENQPAEVRHKALRVVANKTSLAARVDAFRYAPDGSRGIQLRALAKTTMENWFQAPDIKVSDDNTSVVPSAPKHQGSLYDRPTRVSKRTRGLVASRP